MRRLLSFKKVAYFFCLSALCIVKGKTDPLVLDIPASSTWKDSLTNLFYVPEQAAETPSEAMTSLETLPSLNLKKMGGAGQMSTVSFRGQSSRNTHLRIDGIPIQDAAGNVNFSPLFGGATQLTEIIPGSHGVRYGSGASGGVILMETPFLSHDNSFITEIGSFESGYAHLSHQQTNEKTKWVIHGEGARTSGLPQYGKSRKLGEKARARSLNLATRLEHQLDSTSTFKLTARALESETKYDTYDTYYNLLSKPQGTLTTNLSLLGLSFEKHMQGISHRLNGFLSHNKLKSTHAFPSTILLSGANYTGTYSLSPCLESILLTGVEEHRIDSNKQKKSTMFSLYGGWIQKIRLRENVPAEVGVRIDRHQKFGVNTTYSALVSYIHNNTTFKAGMRTGFLNPSLYSLYVTNDFVEGNPNLKPERTRTIDFGIEHKLPDDFLTVKVTPFWTQTKKMIYTVFQRGRHYNANLTGHTKITGIESQIIYYPQKNLYLSASYTYTNLDYSQANVNPEFPKHKGLFKISYTPQEMLTLSPEIFYVGQRRSYSGQILKRYALVNFSLQYSINLGASIFGRIDNAFDTRYEQTHGYQTPGRAFYVGTRLYF